MEENTKTKSQVLDIIKEKRYQLDFELDIPTEFKSDIDVITSILEHGNLDIMCLPDSARNDRNILMLLANDTGFKLEDFPEWARDDKEIALIAVERSYNAFEHLSDRLRSDREVVIKALTCNSSYNTISFVGTDELKNDLEILKLAVKGHKQAFGYIPEKWRTNRELIELVLAAEVAATSSFEYFPPEYRDNEEIAKKVVKDDASCFEYLSERLRNNKEIALLAVSKSGMALREMPEMMLDDKDIVLAALSNDGWRYCDKISDRLKNDIDVVLAAVSSDNRTLEDFPEVFKDNERVVEACLKGNGSAFSYFSHRMRNDRGIALKMSAKWGFKLKDAPENFKNDREIVRNAVKVDDNNFDYVGSELIQDFGFLKELATLNKRVLSHLTEFVKAQIFTTSIFSIEHFGNKLTAELILDDGYVKDNARRIHKSYVSSQTNTLVTMQDFPFLTYEEDGPVGSYLSVRYMNNFSLCGNFIFFIKQNSARETYTNSLARGGANEKYGPAPQSNDNFLKHEVYLIPDGTLEVNYSDLSIYPRIYFGRQQFLPKGIQLFPTHESYGEALLVLNQQEVYGEAVYKRINDNALQVLPGLVDEVFGAARVYVDGFGWRFLIPHAEGALKSLDILKATTDVDDQNWLKSQKGVLTDYQTALLKKHFGKLF
jgi:hypothetical protein